LRAVRNILLNLVIPSGGIYDIPVHAFGNVGIGRRSSADSRLVASILFQANDSRMPTLQQYQWDFTIVVEMFYRVSQDVETAELQLADAYPAVMDLFYNNKLLVDPETLLPTVRSSIVTGPPSNPWYESLSGPEYRMQVLFLNCWMRNTFDSNQPV
jgi:hypothetical protein